MQEDRARMKASLATSTAMFAKSVTTATAIHIMKAIMGTEDW